MLIVDTHCDSIELVERGAPCMLTPYNMSAQHIQFAALFTDRPGLAPAQAWQLLCRLLELLRRQAAEHAGQLALCRTLPAALQAVAQGRRALMLSLEGASALEGDPARLRMLAAAGLRCLGLTWNQNNRYGCANPVSGTPQDTGLTPEGHALIRACCGLGILPDISHASDATAADILRVSTLPVLATHSNFREVCPHPRNLPRQLALAVRDSGGVIGLNLYPVFLGGSGIEALWPQLEYGLELVGEDAIGFGFDIDGIDPYPTGLDMGRSLHEQVVELLARRGYGKELIEKLAGGNHLRVLRQVCGAP